jgi:hypothetical protein
MITQIKEVPANMVAFRAMGEVTKDDFEKVVFPAVEAVVDRTGELNYLLLLEMDTQKFTFGAWWQEVILVLKKLFKWRRAAIVTDSESLIRFTHIFSVFAPGVYKGFLPEEFDQAVTWVSGHE